MLHYLEKIGKNEWRWVYIVSRTADKYDVVNIAKKNVTYANMAILSVLFLAIGTFGGFLAAQGGPALAKGDMGGWLPIVMGISVVVGCLVVVGMAINKAIEERKARKHGIRPSVRAVYSDSVPFKALIDTLGPETWQKVRYNILKDTILGRAILFQLDVFFDNTYVTFVTPDGVLNDDSMSARGLAALEANVKPTAAKIRALIKQHDQCVEGRKKEVAAAEEAEQIRETELRHLNLNIAAKA